MSHGSPQSLWYRAELRLDMTVVVAHRLHHSCEDISGMLVRTTNLAVDHPRRG